MALLIPVSPIRAAEDSDFIRAGLTLVRQIPSCEFTYVITTGLSVRRIRFITDGVRFGFFENRRNSDQLLNAFCFDGERFYNLSDYILETSAEPRLFEDYVRSWFGYNPLFNAYKYIFPNKELITPANLSSPQFWEAAQIEGRLLPIADFGAYQNNDSIPAEIKNKFVLSSSISSATVINRAVGRPAPNYYEIWDIVKYATFKEGEKSFIFPSETKASVLRDNDSDTPYSYTIKLDTTSFKLLPKVESSDVFRVPLSIASQVYDKDRNVMIKRDDWKP